MRRKVDFNDGSSLQAEGQTALLAPVVYDADKQCVVIRKGPRISRIKIGKFPRQSLALELMVWCSKVSSGSWGTASLPTLRQRLKSMLHLMRHIDRYDPDHRVHSLVDVDATFLLEIGRYVQGETARRDFQDFLTLLKAVRSQDRTALSTSLAVGKDGRDPLKPVIWSRPPRVTPRNAFSPHVTHQLRLAAKKDCEEALARLGPKIERIEQILKAAEDSSRPRSDSSFADAIRDLVGSGRLSRTDLMANLKARAPTRINTMQVHSRLQPNFVDRSYPSQTNLTDDEFDRLADLIVEGRGGRDIEAELGISVARIKSLKGGSPRFQRVLQEKEDAFLAHTVLELRKRPIQIPTAALARNGEILFIPGFRIKYDKATFKRLSKKIKVIVGWLLEGIPDDYLLRFPKSKKQFVLWDDPALGIVGDRAANLMVGNYPQEGNLVNFVEPLIRALVIQARQRFLREADAIDDPRGILDIARVVAPTNDELTSFLIAISLASKIDLGSLKAIKRDCLKNAAGGYVDIRYRKARAGGRLIMERVRLGGLSTAAGLLATVLRLTEFANSVMKVHSPEFADSPWLFFHGSRSRFVRSNFAKTTESFCLRHELYGDDGERLTNIQLSRARKTVKSEAYRKSAGELAALTDDHSPHVANRHYARIQAHDELHQKAVENGLEEALHDVLVASHEDKDQQLATLEQAGIPRTKSQRIVDGKEDVWLCGCRDYRNSPFGEKGADCPTPYTGCLDCRNAAITPRHLPNILRHQNNMLGDRVVMTSDAWMQRYGREYYRIKYQILPQFSESQIETARCVLQNITDRTPLFHPLEIRQDLSQ